MAGRILIADAVATNRILLRTRLSQAHYRVEVAATGDEIIAAHRRASPEAVPDLVIFDEALPDMAGVELCRRLKADHRARNVPVILMTSSDDAAAGIAALDAGADEFLSKPLDEVTLMARVRSLLRARETHDALDRRRHTVEDLGFAEPVAGFRPAARIAFVTRTHLRGTEWRASLRGLVRDQIEVISPDDALEAGNEAAGFDLFAIEADLAHAGEGLRLLCDLRSRASTRHAAIVVVHRRGDGDTAAMALDLGANDIVAGGFLPAELAIRLRTQIRRKQDADRLRASVEDGLRLAVIDPLTGLYNRRYALGQVARVAERAASSGRPYAVMIADIDHFKAVNDTWGHAAGDAVLIEVSKRLRDNLRDVDTVARIGGEEFLVVMPDTDAETASLAAERLRRVVGAAPIPHPAGGPDLAATVSIGVACGWPEEIAVEPVQGLIDRADRALMASKSEGRNLVTLSQTAA